MRPEPKHDKKGNAMETENEYETPQLDTTKLRYVHALFKNKRSVLSVFLVAALSAFTFSLLNKPEYEARSTVLVKMGREYLMRPELGDRVPPTMSINQEGIISSELQILSSKELRDRVVRELKVARIYPELLTTAKISADEVAVSRLEKALKFSKVKNSNVIEITFTHEDPVIAAQVVNALVDRFREKHLQVFREPQSLFLQQQLEKYTEKLVASEDALEGFKRANDVFSLEEQRSLLLRQKMDLDAELKANWNTTRELKKKVAVLKKQLSAVYKSRESYTLPESNNNIQDAKAKLLALLLEEQQLLRKYTPSNKLVINSKNEIEIVKKFINELENEARTKARTGNQIYLDLYRETLMSEASLNSVVAKTASLENQLAEVDRSLRDINRSEQKLEDLRREKLMNEKNYQVYLEKVEESRMLDEMNRQKLANISVIQAATVPVKPISPTRGRVVMMGVLCGVFLALGVAFALEKTDRTFSTPEKVEKVLGTPVLVSIPYH